MVCLFIFLDIRTILSTLSIQINDIEDRLVGNNKGQIHYTADKLLVTLITIELHFL